ncbi:uncharacterized protein LOC100879594 [Megachile rotundata]|uniref:uncharacterized protein LOC100879594 n=1 Tax=Megachile rotundata TaxID=143995 RepID=UPI000258E2A8|nr:PREDICTED: uncharacterized protein LOC100879594 isoform X1 [Megachile rotundata]XP_012139679.1 PREDICTED: uncharacterized protein LOC100879594 isoform X2 [Megachile rotundata]
MAINRLCTTFRQIIINKQSNIIARYYSPSAAKIQNNVFSPYFLKNETHAAYPEMHVKFMPNTLNIDFGNPDNPLKKNINELPLSKIISSIQEPVIQQSIRDKLPFVDKSYNLPTMENVTEKLAIRLIVIRRKKMKKHKRKKLRRKMKVVWEKIRTRRNVAKAKALHAELLKKIKKAEAFDAREYINKKIAFIKKERIPQTYRGEILPKAMIKEFLAADRERKERRRNKPRLTLD